LRRDTLVYGAALAFDRFLGLLLLPVLTRLLSPADYGAWSQTGVAAGLLMAIVLCAFPTVIVRHYAAAVGPRFAAFRRIGAFCLGLGATVALSGWLAPQTLGRLAYGDSQHQLLVPALLVWMLAEAGIEFDVAWWRALGRIRGIAGVLVLRSVFRLGMALSLAAYSDQPLAGWLMTYSLGLLMLSLCLTALAGWAVSGAHASPAASRPTSALTAPTFPQQLMEATPLMLLSVLTVLSGSLDRYVLAAVLDLEALARYAAAASLAALPFMVHSILGFTLFPVMSRHWASGELEQATRLMDEALLVYLFLSLPISLGVAGLGATVLPLITTSAYQVSPAVFAALSLSVLALGVQQVVVYALLLAGQSARVLRLALFSTVFNLAALALLVPQLGLLGAALATALANLGLATMTARAVRALVTWHFPWRRAGGMLARSAVSALPVALVLAQGWPMYCEGVLALAAAGLLYLGLDWRHTDSLLRRLAAP
jgi:O-antigen/teichoic acid export membrane protein